VIVIFSTENELILTFDIGTTSVKVSLFTRYLEHICTFPEEYKLDTFPGGIVEVDPDQYKTAIRNGLVKVFKNYTGRGTIRAIAITTQGETLIPVDNCGNPLMPAIVWLDNRAQKQAEALAEKIEEEEFYRVTGLPEISGALPLCKLKYIKEELPEIYAKTEKFLLLEDYILHWLTGRFVTEKALQCSTGYFDIINDCYWEKALNIAGIDIDKLPVAVSCGEPVGNILPNVAKELNLPKSVTVVTGAMDQVAAALGAGCIRDGIITETTGTALVMAAYTTNPCFEHPSRVTIYRHALQGSYLYLPIGNTAGMFLKWFRENFCQEIPFNQPNAYALLDSMAENIPAGCNGLITLPYLAGCVNPDNNPAAKGVFFGADLGTTKAHFVRSIMEAVCFMMRDFIHMLSELGVKPEVIYSLGGGSKSELWEQMKADVCGAPFITMKCNEAASTGAALLAGWGSGLLPGNFYPEIEYKKKYFPNCDLEKIYHDVYQKYTYLYRVLKPLF